MKRIVSMAAIAAAAAFNIECVTPCVAKNPRIVWSPPSQGVYDLRCEYLAKPLGVAKPRFFWKWAGKRPEKWKVRVWECNGQDARCPSVVADFETAEHLYVEPHRSFVPFTRYRWSVEECGGAGAEGTFVTGIEKWEKPFFKPPWQHDQKEYWIARKKVTLKEPQSVIISLASLGSHRLYVNGKPASDCFGPNRSHVEDGILLATTYDVTDLVKDGENEFKVYMHDGWAALGQCKEKESCLSVDGRAVTENGVVVIDSAEPWDVSLSADRSYGPIGKNCNGRQRGIEHLCDKERETRHARGVLRTGPAFTVTCDVSERDYAIREIKPVSIEATAAPGKWKIDMGEAFSGFMRLKLKGEKGTVARMTASDTFVDECVFGQISEFEFCGGDGIFENRMNTQSGRFFYLTGCEKPGIDDVTGIVIGCCGRITGGFNGDRDLETILALDRDTFIATTMGGVTVDCPHRERLGYGEASLSAMWGDGMPQFDSAAYYYAYLLKWASSQRPDGSIPHVSPNGYGWGGTFWSNFPVYALAEYSRRYPDARLKGIMRPVIDKWLDYLHSHVRADGILAQYEPKKGDCLGDWLYPEIHKTKGTSGDWGHTVEGMFFNNCSYAWAIKQALEIEGLVTDAARRDELKRRHAALVKAIDSAWYKDGLYVSEDARYQSIALLCGAAEAGGHSAETEKAMQDIVERKGYVDGGSPSYTVILRALCMSKRGRELALRTFRRREAPGFLYFADEGYNTIPEDWWYGRTSRGSMIHTCYTGPAGALFHGFAGIEIDGNKITVAPLLSDTLPNFSAYTETLYGTLYVKVESKGGRRVVWVLCPYGCDGTFVADDARHALRPGLNRFEAAGDTPQNVSGEGMSLRAKIAKTCKITGSDVWYGYRRTKFDFKGHKAWVVEPSIAPAKGMPWTWTMQWAEAFVDRTGVPDLLGKGYRHVTIDVFNKRMDESGLKVCAEFQDFLVKELGFAPKANLVGMSWGGFFSTRYAATYPQNVRRIYLDAPLLNFDGFPANAIGVWKASMPADGKWTNDPRMPVNMAEPIAKAGIPVLLLYGGQDQTVPPALNAELFITRFKAAGGQIDVDKRGGFGHHPHGVDPNKTGKIVNFVMSEK